MTQNRFSYNEVARMMTGSVSLNLDVQMRRMSPKTNVSAHRRLKSFDRVYCAVKER